jgi:hypothetical protein
LTWADQNHKGIFENLFVNRLLPVFKSVESDNLLTDLGFNFWKGLMTGHPEYKYYIILNLNLAVLLD